MEFNLEHNLDVWGSMAQPSLHQLTKVLEHRLDKAVFDGWSAQNLHYLSVSWISQDSYGHNRLVRQVLDKWMAQKIEHGGHRFSNQPPVLTQEEINSIPGGEASTGNMDSMKFEVLERVGAQMQIKRDEAAFWGSQQGELAESYTALKEGHAQLLTKLANQMQSADGAEPGPASSPEITQEKSVQY